MARAPVAAGAPALELEEPAAWEAAEEAAEAAEEAAEAAEEASDATDEPEAVTAGRYAVAR